MSDPTRTHAVEPVTCSLADPAATTDGNSSASTGPIPASTERYALGDEIFMLVSLMDEPARLPIAGTVVWITPTGSQGNKTQGIGVQFSDDESGVTAKRKIEQLLGAHLGSTRPTHTL